MERIKKTTLYHYPVMWLKKCSINLKISRRTRQWLDIDTPLLSIQVECSQSPFLTKNFKLINILISTIVSGIQNKIISHKQSKFKRGGGSGWVWHHHNITPGYLLPGSPSEYLFVRHEPTASITARDVKFSEAISSRLLNCLFFSLLIISRTSGSASLRP